MNRNVMTLGLVEPDRPPPSPDDRKPSPISKPLTTPRTRPGGLAVSLFLHRLLIALAIDVAIVHAPSAPPRPLSTKPQADAVFLPRAAQVRRMLGLKPIPAPTPLPP